MQKQLMDQWCWAAVASTVSFYYYNNLNGLRQADVASMAVNPVCSIVTADNAADYSQCDEPQDLGYVLKSVTHNGAWDIPQALNPNQIIHQLNGGYPICCQINWNGITVAHYVLLYGIDGDNVLIGDPAANNYWAPYDYLTSNFANNGGFWSRSIGTQAV
ncbi:hypothetical protein GCM10011511_54190 [Puia dinghuensis]|uniref:Uncharacterized protein n=2 Tax=Puia dinghuensis TaxID=1792502 RepID=A0A8J2UIK0_9BACT|nr:hypothetical protein GCM10011511_54190 [Puia dinghuensis]